MNKCSAVVASCLGVALVLVQGAGAEEKADRPLPDFSEGLAGLLGPFRWTRTVDIGADARFCDDTGRPDVNGRFLWTYQFMRAPRRNEKFPMPHHLHERSNLVSVDTNLAYDVQYWNVLLNCPRSHNFKLMVGYLQNAFAFQHGDNADLVHLAAGDRLVLFLPVRSTGDGNKSPATAQKQENYTVSPFYGAQSISLIEFKAGEMISYDWFRGGPGKLDGRILFDLAPYFADEKAIAPGVMKPVFRLTIDGKGGWKICVKRDGRNGFKGSARDADWDHVFTHESPGAKPYTVGVTRKNSRWAMSTFSPGGSPEESSEVIIGLNPFDRDTGADAPWPERNLRIHSALAAEMDRALAGGTVKALAVAPPMPKEKKP